MPRQGVWRALAATYAVVAAIQLYLALTTDVTWAWVLTAVCGAAATGFGGAAFRERWAPAAAGDPFAGADA